jgi:hypothetical protein
VITPCQNVASSPGTMTQPTDRLCTRHDRFCQAPTACAGPTVTGMCQRRARTPSARIVRHPKLTSTPHAPARPKWPPLKLADESQIAHRFAHGRVVNGEHPIMHGSMYAHLKATFVGTRRTRSHLQTSRGRNLLSGGFASRILVGDLGDTGLTTVRIDGRWPRTPVVRRTTHVSRVRAA